MTHGDNLRKIAEFSGLSTKNHYTLLKEKAEPQGQAGEIVPSSTIYLT